MNLPTLLTFGVFFCLLGSCIGSFLNVVIWRLPHRGREILYQQKRGKMTLSWPPSHCPVCDAPIQWYQNIPMLSYLFLGGKCANCRTPIPIRYPLVELATAVLFLGFYLAYFVAGWQPGINDVRTDWPPFLLHLFFASALLAASAIDADYFIIPLGIPWLLVVAGLAGSALIGPPLTLKTYPVIPSLSNWEFAKPVAGAAIGLLVANVLLWLKILPQSFGEHFLAELERAKASATSRTPEAPDDKQEKEEPLAPPPKLTRFKPAAASAMILCGLALAAWAGLSPQHASLTTICVSILIFLIGVLPRDAGQADYTDDVMQEISVPHVRREVSKELLFLAVPLACGALAHFLPITIPRDPWISRTLGSLLGLLVGGGLVWVIRIGGSLAFNKEAMGMGDAHLMAGVGAIIGAPLVVVAFLTAPFLGILWAIVLKIMGKPNVLPYGPWLSVASILVLLLGDPIIKWYLSLMLGPLAGP